MNEYLQSVGGRFVSPYEVAARYGCNGEEGYWDFGYRQPFTLTQAERDRLVTPLRAITPYEHKIHVNDSVDDIDLTKLWAHPMVLAGLGSPFIGFGQQTGSCVGAGGGNVEASTCFLEVILLNEPERIFLPFWPLTYGRSRYYLGDTSQGEGSLESTWAKAAIQDGVLPSAANLPQFTAGDGSLQCGSRVEMQWSDGDSRPLIDHLGTSRQHLITKAEICRAPDDVWNAIGALKCIGHGSMYGYNVTGKMDDNGEAMGKRGPRWSHKETILGRRIYKGKRWFKNVNQWFYQGAKIVWIPEEDVQWICNDGEVYAYSGLQGIPEEKLDWGRLW